jgi:predicted nucleic acid-binding protein
VILVDSSVWIDYLRGNHSTPALLLDSLIDSERLLVGDLILCEVLRGVASERQAREVEAELRHFEVVPLVDPDLAVQAAAHYRALRARGITLRKTIDLLIGTYCMAHGHALLHADRDFDPMEAHLGLLVIR